MKKLSFALAILLLALIGVTGIASAQADGLQLTLSKSMGFAQGNQIQGSFNIAVSGRDDLASVTFLMDGLEMVLVDRPPFRYSFSTDSYTTGPHRLSATARTTGGQTVQSNVINVEILSAAESWQATTRVMAPILGIVLVVVVVMLAIQFLPIGRNRRQYVPGEQRDYGRLGGFVCPGCGRPFARSALGMNMMVGKLERCPYCGKWSITKPATIEALRAAEQSEVQGAVPEVHEMTPEERLRQQIEESRMSK